MMLFIELLGQSTVLARAACLILECAYTHGVMIVGKEGWACKSRSA